MGFISSLKIAISQNSRVVLFAAATGWLMGAVCKAAQAGLHNRALGVWVGLNGGRRKKGKGGNSGGSLGYLEQGNGLGIVL
jgi:hypothetical protein